VNEAQFPEFVHEEIDPPASCAHHLCQSFLTNLGNYNFRFTFPTEASQPEENTSQPFLTGFEMLVNQILFVSDIPRQQIGHEHVGKCMLPVNHVQHAFLIDAHYRAIGHGGCGARANSLSQEAAFSKEIVLVQNAYRGFLSRFR
jgi:hypothetical protein